MPGRGQPEQDEDRREAGDEEQAGHEDAPPARALELGGRDAGDRREVAGHERQHAGGEERHQARRERRENRDSDAGSVSMRGFWRTQAPGRVSGLHGCALRGLHGCGQACAASASTQYRLQRPAITPAYRLLIVGQRQRGGLHPPGVAALWADAGPRCRALVGPDAAADRTRSGAGAGPRGVRGGGGRVPDLRGRASATASPSRG